MSEYKSVLISGGSSGLGLAIAKLMMPDYEVTILSRNCPDSIKHNIQHIKIDFTEKNALNNLTYEQKKKIRDADILINNVGIFSDSRIDNLNDYNYFEMFSINVFSIIDLTKIFLRDRKVGRIININSVSGVRAQKHQEFYSASKFALKGFFDSLAQNINSNVKITNVHPAGINTPLWDKHNLRKDLRDGFMVTQEVAEFIKNIINLPKSIGLKEIHLQPSNEWNF